MVVLGWEDDRLAGLDQRGRELCEEERLAGRLAPALGRVVAVVQPDADDLARRVEPEALAPELSDRQLAVPEALDVEGELPGQRRASCWCACPGR